MIAVQFHDLKHLPNGASYPSQDPQEWLNGQMGEAIKRLEQEELPIKDLPPPFCHFGLEKLVGYLKQVNFELVYSLADRPYITICTPDRLGFDFVRLIIKHEFKIDVKVFWIEVEEIGKD